MKKSRALAAICDALLPKLVSGALRVRSLKKTIPWRSRARGEKLSVAPLVR